eukprot:scaffold3872_cov19-Tisochrysis_lutea.AAC.5
MSLAHTCAHHESHSGAHELIMISVCCRVFLRKSGAHPCLSVLKGGGNIEVLRRSFTLELCVNISSTPHCKQVARSSRRGSVMHHLFRSSPWKSLFEDNLFECPLQAGGKKIKKKERDEILGELMTGWAGKPAQQQQQGGTPAGKARAPGQTQVDDGFGGWHEVEDAEWHESAVTGAAAAQAEDEDIFGDAGTDYRPSVDPSRKKKAPSQDIMGTHGQCKEDAAGCVWSCRHGTKVESGDVKALLTHCRSARGTIFFSIMSSMQCFLSGGAVHKIVPCNGCFGPTAAEQCVPGAQGMVRKDASQHVDAKTCYCFENYFVI